MAFNVLGLTDETERVYTVLVGLPGSTAAQLAAACELSVPAAARQLAGLVREGLATRATGRPPRFAAVAPDVAVNGLIRRREKQLDEARSQVHRLMEHHREASRISRPDLGVELLTDRTDISDAVQQLTTQAQRQVRAFDRPPYVDRPGSNLADQLQQQRQGISHRVVYDRAAIAWPGRLAGDILASVRAGEQARVRSELPLKMVICDSRAAIVPFSSAPGGQSAAYLVQRSPMLTALERLFEVEWERGVPLPLADGAAAPGSYDDGADEPDQVTRSLLSLLAAGLTDAAIARAQGWSERTTQRRIHRLMSQLGADTRFQAGLTAARRGWL
ncbi:helix-turn-helix domain-containing protein [Streptomyces sp. MMS24-I2-30]|uniref:helix-turn-helix domain-containing protein n=1 Tax=Streptomyces sp. MMS24-I2-30 TaxID=3351564 RepID=UPI003896A6B7